MCGIAGILDTRGTRAIDRALLESMNRVQFHRGPDQGNIHIEPGVGLAHRRLSIIDLSGGRQPLFNEDHSVVIVYNGEIYNFQELARELVSAGHVFKTRCDTEVVVHAWEEWGEDCVQKFRGMFAFAIWDRNQRCLFLARDRLGIKPLYYSLLPDGQLMFASELKGLLVNQALPRKIGPEAVEDYFAYGYIPDPRTIFDGVYKLSPGHTLTVRVGKPLPPPREYWDVPFVANGDTTIEAAGDELIERLREAVRIRLISDVPLGAFLSGGVDSSAVVAMMAETSSEAIDTCSISFGSPQYDESRYAAKVAERYQTRHHVEQVDSDNFDLIDELARIYDEPFADSSSMPTYRVCEVARKHVTVALSGDGGDESLAGYRRYRWHVYEESLRSLIPGYIRGPIFGALGRLYPKADWAPKMFRAKSTLESIARGSVDGYFHSVSIMSESLSKRLFCKEFIRTLQGYRAVAVLERHARRAPARDPLSLIQYLDLKTYLPGDILTKVDRASMAHSLEVRVPILDHQLVEWTSGLPPRFKLNGREGKFVFKKALERYISHDVLYREKMGFAVPLADWFRGPLRERVKNAILGPVLADAGFFNRKFLETLVGQHQSGMRDHSAPLWSLLMFEAFCRNSSAN